MKEKIGKLIKVGGVGEIHENYDGFRMGDRVYDMDGISPALTAQPLGNAGGFSPLFIDMEMIRCLRLVRTEQAKKIRKQYENHEIDFPRSQLQQLEIREDECCNTITTVLKDNLVMEMKPDVLGFIDHGTGQHQSNIVYHTDSVSPAITTIQGGTQQIKIAEEVSEEMDKIKIKCANSQGFKECEVGGVFDSAFPSADRHSRVIDNGNVSPTLTAEVNGVCAVVGVKQATNQGYIECEVGGVANMAYPESELRHGRVIDKGQVSPTLQAGEPSVCKIESPIAIRKLTPRECWRLMDFEDDQFDRAEKVNSSTQLYKQAGNSIVVACLEAIFSQLGIGEEWNTRDFGESDE